MRFFPAASPDDRARRHAARAEELLAHLAAEFIARETNGTSLITVTRAEVSSKGDRADIFVTVFPDDRVATALDFLNRQAGEFRDYLKKHARMHSLPRVEFIEDRGERNRQRLDELGNIP